MHDDEHKEHLTGTLYRSQTFTEMFKDGGPYINFTVFYNYIALISN